MITKIKKGVRILRTKGFQEFLRQVQQYALRLLRVAYWRVHNVQEVSINEHSAKFNVPSHSIVEKNNYRLETERDFIADLLSELETDDVFYDIGANTGIYSVFAANRCTNGEIIAFEPYPPNHRILLDNIEINNRDNIIARQLALSNSTGSIEFDQPDLDEVGYGSASIGTTRTNSGSLTVETSTGDQLIQDNEVPPPTVVKIDVEGAEPLVISGMEDALSSPSCRLLYCEVHTGKTDRRPSIEEFGSSFDALTSEIRDFGFSVEELQRRDNEVFLKCKK